MQPSRRTDENDRALIQIVDAALAEATRKSGGWLVCRPGCHQCCLGPFAISQLDARRLRRGLAELEASEPQRAAAIVERARQSVARLSPTFPGNADTGLLDTGEDAAERMEAFADDEPCPALSPETGTCELYAARPITCRAFGPPMRCGSGALGICELCFEGASDTEVAACAVDMDPDGLEATILEELEKTTGASGETLVAFSLLA